MKRALSPVGCAGVLALLAAGLLTACEPDPVVLEVTVPTTPVAADGKTPAIIEVKVSQAATPLNVGDVKFTSSLEGSDWKIIADPTKPPVESKPLEVTVEGGVATAKLYSVAKGTAKISIRYAYDAWSLQQVAEEEIIFGSAGAAGVASLKYISATPNKLRVANSGGDENSEVVFRAVDAMGVPVKDADINFTLSENPGGARVEPASAKTDSQGNSKTIVKSGTVPGQVRVQAAVASNPAITQISEGITIVGAPPNHRYFDLNCEKRAIGGFGMDNLSMKCTVNVADRNSMKVENQPVFFFVEAGAIDKTAVTDKNGTAIANYKTQRPDPWDLNPFYNYLPDWMRHFTDLQQEPTNPNFKGTCTRASCNVRDGLVTVLAVTAGEEEWNDTNGNGKWDNGETYVNLPEPYVDANDNGMYDVGETFVDGNSNQRWDPENTQWDGNTQIWRAFQFVWTGDLDPTVGFFDPNGDHKQPITGKIQIEHCGSVELDVGFWDVNYNFPAFENSDTITCKGAKAAVKTDVNGMTLNTAPIGGKLHGHRFLRVKITDAHVCLPKDCKSNSTPCPPVPSEEISCTANFTRAPGSATKITGTIEVLADVD